MSPFESLIKDASSLAFKKNSLFGSAISECIISTMILQVIVAAIVAGVRVGAGADDTVCVREFIVRDLSRNSTMV